MGKTIQFLLGNKTRTKIDRYFILFNKGRAETQFVSARVCKRRNANLTDEERAVREKAQAENGLVVASGLLGGESIVGIILAMAVAASALG